MNQNVPRAFSACLLVSLPALHAACDVGLATPTPPELVLVIDGVEPRPGEVLELGAVTLDPDAEVSPSLRLAVRLENRGRSAVDLEARPPLRLRGDPALAFRAVQPSIDSLEPGQSAQGQIIFAPSSAGAYSARLTVDTDPPLSRPVDVHLQARAEPPARAEVLALRLEDAEGAAVEALAVGTVPLATPSERQLSLVNTGNVPLSRSALRATLAPSAGAFQVTLGEELDVVPPSARLSLTVRAGSTVCGTFSARLTIGTTSDSGLAGADLRVTIGAASVSVRKFVPTLGAGLDPAGRLGVGQPGLGAWRVVAGEPEGAAGEGGLRWLDFDGCETSEPVRIPTPAQTPSGWGHRVSTDALGDFTVVSWPNHPKVRLLRLEPDVQAPSEAELGTARSGEGFGQSVLVASGAEVALVGQPLAASGGAPQGAVLLFQRPLQAWADLAEPTFRLLASAEPRPLEVGTALTASRRAELVLAAGWIASGSGRELAAWLWRSSVSVNSGLVWGRRIEGGVATERLEAAFRERGYRTSVDRDGLAGASAFIRRALGAS